LKVLNHFKEERDFIDKIRPIKVFIFFGILFDFLFTIRFCLYSAFYFLRTRLSFSKKRETDFELTIKMLLEGSSLFQDLEREARAVLVQKKIKTIIFGHTHFPMNKIYPDGCQYINTGTWTRMIHLDPRRIGQPTHLTFAHVHYRDQEFTAELRHWIGEHGPERRFFD
jgi:hypothetical protein